MLPILGIKEDGAAALDAHHRAIAEPHSASDAGVQVEEGISAPRHVVGGPGVEDPLA